MVQVQEGRVQGLVGGRVLANQKQRRVSRVRGDEGEMIMKVETGGTGNGGFNRAMLQKDLLQPVIFLIWGTIVTFGLAFISGEALKVVGPLAGAIVGVCMNRARKASQAEDGSTK